MASRFRPDLILAVLLRPVERAVGTPDELVPADRLDGHRGEPRADGDRARRPRRRQLDRRDPLHDRLGGELRPLFVPAGEEDGELVPAEPERLAALAQARRELREHLVAAGMAVAVVDPLEVVDVHEAEAERIRLLERVGDLALESVVKMPVVTQSGKGVGEREPHRAQLPEGRALVERDREQRADERSGE